jgi:hypothetical protein
MLTNFDKFVFASEIFTIISVSLPINNINLLYQTWSTWSMLWATNLKRDTFPSALTQCPSRGWLKPLAFRQDGRAPDHLVVSSGSSVLSAKTPDRINGVTSNEGMPKLERFLLRGLNKVNGEFSFWCITHNVLKLYRNGGDMTPA